MLIDLSATGIPGTQPGMSRLEGQKTLNVYCGRPRRPSGGHRRADRKLISIGDGMNERILEDPALRQRPRFERTNDGDGSAVLHVETWVDPGGVVKPHLHPAMEQRFEVLAGQPTFLAGDVAR
jgi:hypothetical protein